MQENVDSGYIEGGKGGFYILFGMFLCLNFFIMHVVRIGII